MANGSFTGFKTSILNGGINLSTGVLKVACIAGYTYNAAHVFFSEVTGAGGVVNGSAVTLTNPTVVAGVFDADDCTITTTASASNHVLVVYQASAVGGGADVAASAQRLCWYFDPGTNLPIQPSAGTLTITWPNTAAKIYKIGA